MFFFFQASEIQVWIEKGFSTILGRELLLDGRASQATTTA